MPLSKTRGRLIRIPLQSRMTASTLKWPPRLTQTQRMKPTLTLILTLITRNLPTTQTENSNLPVAVVHANHVELRLATPRLLVPIPRTLVFRSQPPVRKQPPNDVLKGTVLTLDLSAVSSRLQAARPTSPTRMNGSAMSPRNTCAWISGSATKGYVQQMTNPTSSIARIYLPNTCDACILRLTLRNSYQRSPRRAWSGMADSSSYKANACKRKRTRREEPSARLRVAVKSSRVLIANLRRKPGTSAWSTLANILTRWAVSAR